ncbi:MAG: Rossmann-like and DUF2520 domain-containing protein [Acidimicrobiia bacterium]
MTRFAVVGPGRAGGALAIALHRAGHEVAAVIGRDRKRADLLAELVSARSYRLGSALPEADIVLLAVRDDAIEPVAETLAENLPAAAAVHLSGLQEIRTLQSLAARGAAIGSWHPLQTLPNAEVGADRLEGAWMAITTDSEELAALLEGVSQDLGARPFRLADELKPLYHAAAAAAANYVTAALGLAESLATAAGVPYEAARPLVNAVTSNVFSFGAESALTGPIARGDISTVEAQLAGIRQHAPHLEEDFRAFGRATARLAGTLENFEGIL